MTNIHLKSILKEVKSTIFLDGELPPENLLTKDILPHLQTINIAADGAIKKLHKVPINTIVGDLDSQDPDLQGSKIPLVQINDQDTTDFEKCISYAEYKGLTPALILGIGGGEIDHALNNLFTFARYDKNNSLSFLHYVQESSKWQIGFMVSEDTEITGLSEGAYASLIPLPSATVSSDGLQWELNNHSLDISALISARNRIKKQTCSICPKKGKVLFITDFIAS